jgi:hypothetical protein
MGDDHDRDKGWLRRSVEPAISPFDPKHVYFVRVNEAAEITGLPPSLIRKSFIAEAKRPRNVPAPPPHMRIGRAVYIIRDQLPAWLATLVDGSPKSDPVQPKRRRTATQARVKG